MPPPPSLEFHLSPGAESLLPPNLHLDFLERVGLHALPGCLAAAPSPGHPLAALTNIEVTLTSDSEIAAVHAEFLADPTPTDVITFHHGEILISLETAARQAPEHGFTLPHEAALYLIHGLLHLAGWDDHDPGQARAMAALQEDLLRAALAANPR
jgi:probable rRNA maturation factor